MTKAEIPNEPGRVDVDPAESELSNIPLPHSAETLSKRQLAAADRDYGGAGVAERYATEVGHTLGPDQLARQFFYRIIPKDLSGMRVLDIACGNGSFTYDDLPLRNPTKVIGIDIEREMIAVAKAQAGDRAKFGVMDMHRLGLRDHSFDLAVSGFGLHYSEDLGGLFKEIARVLKPGADLIFLTNMVRSPHQSLQEIGEVQDEIVRGPKLPIILTPGDNPLVVLNIPYAERDYVTAMRQAGFELVDLTRFKANHKLHNKSDERISQPPYPYAERIDLHAVVVTGRKL